MSSASNQMKKDFHCRQPRFRFIAKLGIVHLALVLSFSGCVMPPTEGKKVKASKQEESLTASAVEPSEKEEAKPQKQETLAAVEEFLSRTQEYRFPAKREPENSMAAVASRPIGPTVQPAGTAQAAAPPRDAAYANAQISLVDQSVPVTPQAIPAIESVSIRSPEPKSHAPSTPPKPQMTNGPLELSSSEKNESIELLVTSLKEELKTKKNVDTEWKLRMLLLSLGREVDEAAITDNAPAELKGILPAWGAASASIRSLLRDPVQGSESAVERVDLLREMLTGMGDPRVRSVALCRKVMTYGSYEEMASEEFVSGRSIQTIVYAEIESLRSSNPGGVFETKLSTRLEVLTSDGKSMWQREEPEVVDRCRRPRRDFFVAQRITLPPTLPAGQYVLKVSVEDKTSGKIAESTAPFTIHSPISVAKGQ